MRWADMEQRHEDYGNQRACQDSVDDRPQARKRSVLVELWQAARMAGYRARYTRQAPEERDDA